MPLAVGDRLGPHEILVLVGKGGMGEVYKARDTRLNRDVAVKLSAERFSERFDREARAIAALNHPNICTLYDVGPNYLVMEFVEGESLADRLKQGALPLQEALDIARQVMHALEAAHEKGITHRDLKPGNVMLRSDGTVKVLDFGLAKLGGNTPTASGMDSPTISMAATQAGVILGTAAYMAPEQARGKPVDKRADIWAFGVLLHEMVTGKRLFQGEDLTETLAAVVMRDPDLGGVPTNIERVLRRCLEKDPKKRLRDISSVELLLEDAPAPAPAVAASPKRSVLPWSIAAAALALASGLGWAYARQPAAPAAAVVRFSIPEPEGWPFNQMLDVSPDGRWLAFTARNSGADKLWLRRLDQKEPHPLVGTENARGGMVWSPDSRFLVFASGGKLRKIAVEGGPAQSLCDYPSAVGGGFFTPDQKWVVFGTPAGGGLMKCPLAGGAAVSITRFEAGGQEAFHAFPTLLPDGKHFLFMRFAGPNSGVYLGDLEAKPEDQLQRRVVNEPSAAVFVPGTDGHSPTILFTREGTLLAQPFNLKTFSTEGEPAVVGESLANPYSVSFHAAGPLAYLTQIRSETQYQWLEPDGREGAKLGGPRKPFSNLRIAPDGKRAAGHRADSGARPDIWLLDLTQGAETKLTTDPGGDSTPVWSPDSQRIAFRSNREGSDNLYVRAADGSGSDELLLKSEIRKFPIDWSSNGFLMYGTQGIKSVDLWVLPMSGDHRPSPFLVTDDANESNARFSPDGRWVAYTSDVSGKGEVYVRPFDPAAPDATHAPAVKISGNGGATPRWLNSGKTLDWSESGSRWAVDVQLTPTFKILGAPRKIREAVPAATVAPDDRVLVGEPLEGGKPTIEVILNWQQLLSAPR